MKISFKHLQLSQRRKTPKVHPSELKKNLIVPQNPLSCRCISLITLSWKLEVPFVTSHEGVQTKCSDKAGGASASALQLLLIKVLSSFLIVDMQNMQNHRLIYS